MTNETTTNQKGTANGRPTVMVWLPEYLSLRAIEALAAKLVPDAGLEPYFYSDAARVALEVLERLGPEAVPQTDAGCVRAVYETPGFDDICPGYVEATAALVPYLADMIPKDVGSTE